jgi:MFS family permease
MTALLQRSHATAAPSDARRTGPVFSRVEAFWIVTGMTAALLAASSAPSPLYPVYQAEFGFSALTLTAIFAVYVLALLLSLLTVGRLSDFLGRRPVLAAALVVEAGAMAVFLDAHGVAALFAARVIQGLATGAALGVVGAYLLDLQPADGSRLGSLVNSAAAAGGLGLGATVTGILIQYGPQPTRLVFAILTAVFIVLALATSLLPETVERKAGARASLRPGSLSPPRLGAPFSAPSPRSRRRGCSAG